MEKKDEEIIRFIDKLYKDLYLSEEVLNHGSGDKYDKGSDHMPLVKSLQGYNTEWCTAGESTAKSQLKNGDFYVYYTLDENDEYKVPRIAIRMKNNSIGEIRGVAKDQNIEPNMEKVVKEKIKDFPDKEKYYKKEHDMEQLTKIYDKHKKQQELTKEELKEDTVYYDGSLSYGSLSCVDKTLKFPRIIKGNLENLTSV